MTRARVAVVGGTGMLGSMLVDVLGRADGLVLIATARSSEAASSQYPRLPGVEWHVLDVGTRETTLFGLEALGAIDWYINAIGIIKPYIRDENPGEVERAIRVNSQFPFDLARFAGDRGARVIQFATDCVYAGTRGRYLESDRHDSLDVYGKTKSLGEARLDHVHLLRCSFVGPEPKSYVSLLEWFRRQPRGAQANGFTNHVWNGVTTLHIARICAGIIRENLELPTLQHVVPAEVVNKAELLQMFARHFDRSDITIRPVEASVPIDRSLDTENANLNGVLWRAAGCEAPPGINAMIAELAQHEYAFAGPTA